MEIKMRTIIINIIIILIQIIVVLSFGGSDDKFLKKYAMMKIYESCFGPEVVKQIRKEMKIACAKCATFEMSSTGIPVDKPVNIPSLPPSSASSSSSSSSSSLPPKNIHGEPENNLYSHSQPPSFDAEKLHQAILAYRPNPIQSGFYRPLPAEMTHFYNQPFANPTYSSPMFYQGFAQQSPHFSPYFPIIGQPYFNNRASRDMDIRGQLEMITSKMSGRVRNVTCVMQELGYLDDNLEPNYAKIMERISSLPVGDELKNDMQEGVTFCQQFSQCVPKVKKNKSPLSRELMGLMFFFKCYKHKKLEACIMKDVREKYSDITEGDFDDDIDYRRTGKNFKLPKIDGDIDELATSMYEFLYGSTNSDFDSVL